MRILLAIPLLLLLTACGGGQTLAVKKEQIVVMPPESWFICPEFPEVPPPGYTQKDVADFLLRMYNSNKVCSDNLAAVKQFLIDAKKLVEENK